MSVPFVQSVAQKTNEEIAAAREAMDTSHSASGNTAGSAKRKERKERGKEAIEEYEEEGLQLWAQAKHKLLQPGVAGGLMGVGASLYF